MPEDSEWGAWLRARRQALQLTQRAVGTRAGCAVETVKKWESGQRRPSPAAAVRLAAALDIPPAACAAFVAFARGGRALTWDPGPAAPVRLPLPPTSYIGAPDTVAAVCDLLSRPEVRLLTLTGPPGIGKTRLSLVVAARMAATRAGGVAFVSLEAVRDPDLVAPTIAHAVGAGSGEAPENALGAYLQDRPLLLVLDNFEQVLPAAPLIARLLAAPGLTVVVTSRAPLQIYGEHIWPLQPLAGPPPGARRTLDELVTYPAIRLFVDRARAGRPDFLLTAQNAAAVATICARLDGLPLAIELAAASVRLLAPETLLAQIAGGLDLAAGGPRDWPPRRQALRLAIAWSDDLLAPAARRLWLRLAVCRSGCSVAAAQALLDGAEDPVAPAAPPGPPPPADAPVWPLLVSLYDHSLLWQREQAGAPRFGMLETIREFALERLESSGELVAARRQHTRYFLHYAQAACQDWATPPAGHWLDLLEAEHDNLRAALDWCGEDASPESRVAGLRLVDVLWRFWELRDHLSEARGRLDAALGWAVDAVPGYRGRLLWIAGRFAGFQGDHAAARGLLVRAVACWRSADERFALSFGLLALGNVLLAQGDRPAAASLYMESLAIRRTLDQPEAVAGALTALATVAALDGDFARAGALLEEALPLTGQPGREYDRAQVLLSTADLALRQGAPTRARALLDASWALLRTVGQRVGLAECLGAYARVAAAEGRPARAAQLLGCAAAQLEAAGVRLGPERQIECDRTLAAVRTRLGPGPAAAHLAAGRHLTPDAARRVAPTELAPAPDLPAGRPIPGPALTPRERTVLAALAAGLTNAQIAGRLCLSRHTVNAHLRAIYAKLDVTTRSAATRYALDHHLV